MLELAILCLIAVVIVVVWQPFFRLVLLGVILFLKRLLLKSETVIGKENVPKKGSVLVLTNHFTTGEEAGLLFYYLTLIKGLMQVYLLYKKELEEGTNLLTKLGGLVALIVLRGAGFRPTRREHKDEVASAWTAKKLDQKKTVLGMPEGTSRHPGLIIAKRKGLARIALKGNHPITPAAIPNGAKAISDGLKYWSSRFKIDKRHDLITIFGKTFYLSDLGITLENDPTGERATTEIMVRVGSMLPKDLWGEYGSAIADYLKSDQPHAAYYRDLRASLSLLG